MKCLSWAAEWLAGLGGRWLELRPRSSRANGLDDDGNAKKAVHGKAGNGLEQM